MAYLSYVARQGNDQLYEVLKQGFAAIQYIFVGGRVDLPKATAISRNAAETLRRGRGCEWSSSLCDGNIQLPRTANGPQEKTRRLKYSGRQRLPWHLSALPHPQLSTMSLSDGIIGKFDRSRNAAPISTITQVLRRFPCP